jgi:hypothetical protein
MTGASTDLWKVIAYEVRMFKATYEIMLDPSAFAQLQKKVVENAVEESAVLHTKYYVKSFLIKDLSLMTWTFQSCSQTGIRTASTEELNKCKGIYADNMAAAPAKVRLAGSSIK